MSSIKTDNIKMYINTEEIIRIDKNGFHYRGEFIEDAGMAHRLLLTYLQQTTSFHPEIIQSNEEQSFDQGIKKRKCYMRRLRRKVWGLQRWVFQYLEWYMSRLR